MSDDTKETAKLRWKASQFCIIVEIKYMRGFSLPLLRYVHDKEAKVILNEVH